MRVGVGEHGADADHGAQLRLGVGAGAPGDGLEHRGRAARTGEQTTGLDLRGERAEEHPLPANAAEVAAVADLTTCPTKENDCSLSSRCCPASWACLARRSRSLVAVIWAVVSQRRASLS